MENLISISLGYFLGSIPFSWLIAKMKGIDLKKKVKNGQIGASAVRSNIGFSPAVLAGLSDFSKGSLAIWIAKKLTNSEWIIVLTGLAVIIGHNWSLFLKFWGGKGAAPSFGALFPLLPLPFLLSLPLIFPFILVKRNKIFRLRKTSFFTGLGYLSLSIFSFLLGQPFPFAFSPILFSLPMIFKKN